MTMPVYVLARIPGATDTVEWTDVCHSKEPFIYVDYQPVRWPTRWTTQVNKRPFFVYVRSRGRFGSSPRQWSTHHTLAAAVKAATKIAKEIA